jgi:hypothetical protein
VGIALVFAAAGFGGVAIFVLLQPPLGIAGAAAMTALALIVLPAFWAVWRQLSPAPPPPIESPQTAALAVLAGLARKNPLIAVLGAGLLGVGQYLVRRR